MPVIAHTSRFATALTTAVVLVAGLVSAAVVPAKQTQADLTVPPGWFRFEIPAGADGLLALHTSEGDALTTPRLTTQGAGPGRVLVQTVPLWTGTYTLTHSAGQIRIRVGDPTSPEYATSTSADFTACENSDWALEVSCISGTIKATVKQHGATVTRDALLDVTRRRSDITHWCATLAYGLAEAVVGTLGVQAALQADAQFCRFSYLHGVMAAAAIRGATIEELVEFCTTATNGIDEAMSHNQCGHGIGHGAFYVTDSVTNAGEWCAEVPVAYGEQSNCFEGIFMSDLERIGQFLYLSGTPNAPSMGESWSGQKPAGCLEFGAQFGEQAGRGCLRYTMRWAAQMWRVSPQQDRDTLRDALLEELQTICLTPGAEKFHCSYGLGEALFQVMRQDDITRGLVEDLYPLLISVCSNPDLEEQMICRRRTIWNLAMGNSSAAAAQPLCDFIKSQGIREEYCGEDLTRWITDVGQTAGVDPRVPS
jgi:hypothetical protein